MPHTGIHTHAAEAYAQSHAGDATAEMVLLHVQMCKAFGRSGVIDLATTLAFLGTDAAAVGTSADAQVPDPIPHDGDLPGVT